MELILGQIPQAIYFALFLIFTKEIKTKRILFVILMILGYIGLCKIIQFNIWLNIIHTILIFIVLKFLYRDKAIITDIITFFLSNLLYAILSLTLYSLFNVLYNITLFEYMKYIWFASTNIISIIFIYKIRLKLKIIENFYKKFWNRHNYSKQIKSVTIRGISAIGINILFYLSYIVILYFSYINNNE